MVHSFYCIHFLLRIGTDGADDDDDNYSINDDAFFMITGLWDDDDDGDYNNEYRLQLFWPQFCVLASLASGRGEPH